MIEKEISRVPLYKFEVFVAVPEIRHFVTGRRGVKNEDGYTGFNLSYNVNDDPEKVKKNRWLLASALNIPAGKLIFPIQTHSNNVKLINALNYTEEHTDTDALICNSKGICIGVMAADCVPILLYDPVHKAIAAIHAGWRGTANKIIEKTLKAMVNHFGTGTSDIIAGIGPSIGQDVYEVGPDVINAFEGPFLNSHLFIKKTGEDKGHVDLVEANRLQLMEMGVKASNIEQANICTYTQNNLFYSARRSNNKDGRFAAGIMLL